MSNPSIDDLVRDLFFIKKVKDETVKKMDAIAEDFEDMIGSIEVYFENLQNMLDRLSPTDRHLMLSFIARHEKVMALMARLIYGIEEVLRE